MVMSDFRPEVKTRNRFFTWQMCILSPSCVDELMKTRKGVNYWCIATWDHPSCQSLSAFIARPVMYQPAKFPQNQTIWDSFVLWFNHFHFGLHGFDQKWTEPLKCPCGLHCTSLPNFTTIRQCMAELSDSSIWLSPFFGCSLTGIFLRVFSELTKLCQIWGGHACSYVLIVSCFV